MNTELPTHGTAGFWSQKLRALPMSWGRLLLRLKECDQRQFWIRNCTAMSWDGETQFDLGPARDRQGRLLKFESERAVIDALRKRFSEADWQLDVVIDALAIGEPSFEEALIAAGADWRFMRWKPSLPIDPIPRGLHCKACPYLEHRPDKPAQQSGYCRYLEWGDWMGLGLLWDGCKSCNVKLC